MTHTLTGYDAIKAVAQYSKATGQARHLLYVIASYYNSNNGLSWPSLQTLAKSINVQWTSAVSRSLKALVRLGELQITYRSGHSNTYRILLPIKANSPKPTEYYHHVNSSPIPEKQNYYHGVNHKEIRDIVVPTEDSTVEELGSGKLMYNVFSELFLKIPSPISSDTMSSIGLSSRKTMRPKALYSRAKSKNAKKERNKFIYRYNYVDPVGGKLLAGKARYIRPDGSKYFCWYSADNTPGLVDGCKEKDLPLYALHKLFKHTDIGYSLDSKYRNKELIYLCEGEKSVDALNEKGIASVCLAGGAASKHFDALNLLSGCNVVLWPDNDIAGRRLMINVSRHLLSNRIARSVRWYDPDWEGKKEHDDAYDYVAAVSRGKGLESPLTAPQ